MRDRCPLYPPKADIDWHQTNVCLVPQADIPDFRRDVRLTLNSRHSPIMLLLDTRTFLLRRSSYALNFMDIAGGRCCTHNSRRRLSMPARVKPAQEPYAPEIQKTFESIMPPGVPPLVLFTTLARDLRLYERFRNGALLDKGHLTLRQREVVINRITALSGSEYEWGVHVAFFAKRVGLESRNPTSDYF